MKIWAGIPGNHTKNCAPRTGAAEGGGHLQLTRQPAYPNQWAPGSVRPCSRDKVESNEKDACPQSLALHACLHIRRHVCTSTHTCTHTITNYSGWLGGRETTDHFSEFWRDLKGFCSRKNSVFDIKQPWYGLSPASNQLYLWLIHGDFVPTQSALKKQRRVFLGEESVTSVLNLPSSTCDRYPCIKNK